MEKFSTRLYEAMKLRKIKAIQLAKSTNISRSTITNYLRDEYQPKSDKTFKMANALNVNPAWLLGYDVEMEKPFNKKTDILSEENGLFNNEKVKNNQFYLKHYISNLSAGSFDELLAYYDDEHLVPIPTKFKAIDKRINCFKINGTSMNKVIADGSIVVAVDNNNNAEPYKNGDIVVVFYNNEATIKRLYDEDEYIVLKPDSNDVSHKMIFIQKNLDDFYIIGKVVWHMNPDDMEDMYRNN